MVRADKRKFHYIYKIIRNGSNRYYVGMHSTDNIDDGYFGSGTLLWKSINKYGKENHTMEILEFCESREQLKIREKEIIGDLWKLDEACMNLKGGGEGGGGFFTKDQQKAASIAGNMSDSRKTEVFKQKISEAQIKRYSENPNSPNGFRNKEVRDEMTKRARSPEANAKRKKTLKERNHQQGEKNSQFGTMWISNKLLKQCRKINKNDPIPEGWNKGRKI